MTPIPADEQFLIAFEALAQAVRRARGAGTEIGGADGAGGSGGVATSGVDGAGRLTLSQYGLLVPLAGGGAARVSELAAQAGVAPSTATRILDGLQRRGIVRRTRSRVDRRAVTVTLTEAGERLLGRHHDWMRERRLTFFSGLPEGEQAVVGDLLERLAALIDELAAGPR